jgi:hypothetical protein
VTTATRKGGRFGVSGAVFDRLSSGIRSIIAHLLRKDFI